MAFLAWITSQKMFLKVQEGTGGNLSREDWENGFVSYVLWSTFIPEELDVDEELQMQLHDGGMVMYKKKLTQSNFVSEGLRDAYEQAFDRPFAAEDAIVLMNDFNEEDAK